MSEPGVGEGGQDAGLPAPKPDLKLAQTPGRPIENVPKPLESQNPLIAADPLGDQLRKLDWMDSQPKPPPQPEVSKPPETSQESKPKEAPDIRVFKAIRDNRQEDFKQGVIDWMRENPNMDPMLILGVGLVVGAGDLKPEQKNAIPQLIADAKKAATMGGLEAFTYYQNLRKGLEAGMTQEEYDRQRDALKGKFSGVVAHLRIDLDRTAFGPKLLQLEADYNRRKMLERFQRQNQQAVNKTA